MKDCRLSIAIATVDPHRPLKRTLESIALQIGPEDEILVGIDTAEAEAPKKIIDLIREYDPICQWCVLDFGHHCWGHCQIDYLLRHKAHNPWLTYIDDDDIFAEGALDRARLVIDSLPRPMPMIFKLKLPDSRIIWTEKKLDGPGIGGPMMVAPNDPGKLGKFGCRLLSDYQWLIDTCKAWGEWHWVDSVLKIMRPTPRDWPERWTK